MRVDDLRALSLFDGLTDGQLAELIDGGTEVAVEPGVELFREGEHADEQVKTERGVQNLECE